MKKAILTILKYLFFLGLGIFLVWWSIHKMGEKNWEECKTALESARYALLVPVFFILIASHISRAIRWRILMKPMGYKPGLVNTFFAVMVGYLANLAVPRLGEVLKCTILGKYEKVPADKLVGTILVERAVDVVSLLLVFIIAVATQAGIIGGYAKKTIQANFLSGNKEGIIIKLAIVIVTVIVIYFLLKFVFKHYGNIGFVKRIKILFKGVGAGLSSIKNLQNKTAFILHTVFIWCCYAGGTYLGFFVIPETSGLPIAAAFPVLAFASIGMIITPGGIGTYQWFIMEVMLLYGIDEGHGYANGMLQWVAQFFIILLVGFISLIALPYYNRQTTKLTSPKR
ncbi:MAG: flippase-like domain-containing protein [Ferruginibacter sp.]|nr:flippase-like domain-containing protein [Ferruginibacter sp.]